jgi:hypothetical protein
MNYIGNKKKEFEAEKAHSERFKSFCSQVYETKKLELEKDELEHFEALREIEANDYNTRKKLFWPMWGLGILMFDQIITIPSSQRNRPRILFNIIIGIPFVSVVCSGLIFYRAKVESHEYAISLCEKYKACD